MKVVLTALALALTMGCEPQHSQPPPAGWGEKAAVGWASDLGDGTPRATCIVNQTEYIGGEFLADCSVNAFGHIHKLWCHYPEMKCSEVPTR